TAGGEAVQGLAFHPLFTIPAAFGVMTLIPIATAQRLSRNGWLATSGVVMGVAVVVAAIAGLQPAYSAIAPPRLHIVLVHGHIANKALWIADTQGPLPPSVRASAAFSATRVKASPLSFGLDWAAPAGAPRFTPPSATIYVTPNASGRRAAIMLDGPEHGLAAL